MCSETDRLVLEEVKTECFLPFIHKFLEPFCLVSKFLKGHFQKGEMQIRGIGYYKENKGTVREKPHGKPVAPWTRHQSSLTIMPPGPL